MKPSRRNIANQIAKAEKISQRKPSVSKYAAKQRKQTKGQQNETSDLQLDDQPC